MVLVRILMSKSGFEDEVLIKLIVGAVVKHVAASPLMSLDLLTIEAAIIEKKTAKMKSVLVSTPYHSILYLRYLQLFPLPMKWQYVLCTVRT
jgi:hypothetical protein